MNKKHNGQSVGYALIDQEGCPLPVTVGATKRAAMALALDRICDVAVSPSDDDAQVEAAFRALSPPVFSISPVCIERLIVGEE